MPNRDRLDFLSDSWRATRPDIDISPWQVWGRTTRIHEIFLGHVTRALRRHSLTYTEFETLGALVLAGPPYRANPTQIQRFNLLTSGGLANLLGRMEAEGLVERHPDPSDKRGVLVQITPRGLQLFNAALVEENRVEHELLAGLNAEERAMLAILLRKLLTTIDPETIAPPSTAVAADAPGRVGRGRSSKAARGVTRRRGRRTD